MNDKNTSDRQRFIARLGVLHELVGETTWSEHWLTPAEADEVRSDLNQVREFLESALRTLGESP